MGKQIFRIIKIIALPAILFFIFLGLPSGTYAQTGSVGIGAETPNEEATAILYLNSTAKGFLAPRMTEAERTGIVSPATGLLVYQINNDAGFWFFNGTIWVKYSPPFAALSPGTGIGGTPYDGTVAVSDWSVSFTTSGGINGTQDIAARGDHYHQTLSPQTDAGLLGGDYDGSTGISDWRVAFAGSGGNFGTTFTVARSDHTHDPADANLEELTAGDGLTGGPYDGTTATEFDVSLSDHSAGDGFTAGSGNYNGLSPIEWHLDFTVSGGFNGTTTTVARGDHTHDPSDANLEELTAGDGLTGGPYDGTTAAEFDVSLDNLNAGTGLSGGPYDGIGTQTFNVDFTTSGGNNGTQDIAARGDHTHPNLLVDGTAPNQTLYWNNTTSSWTETSYLTTDLTNTKVMIGNDGVANGTLSLYSDDADQEVTFTPNGSMTSSTSYTLPVELPSTGTTGFLESDDSGNLSWVSGGAGADEDWVIESTEMYSNTVITSLGIGTETPDTNFLLDVNGSSLFSGTVNVTDGNLNISNTSNTAGSLTLMEPSATGTDNITSFSATAQTDDIHYTLPPDDGDEGDVLMTDGSGELFWGTLDDSDWVIDGTNMYSNTVITNVGIGTENPNLNVLLDVNGAASFSNTVTLGHNGTDPSPLVFNNATSYTSFQMSDPQIDKSIEYILPAEQGASGSVTTMTNDGDGNLSWMTAGDFDKTKNVVVVTNDDYTATNDDYYIIVNTNDTYTVDLPANPDEGKVYFIKAIGGSLTNVNITGGNFDNNLPPLVLSGEDNESVMLLSDGTDWFIMSRYKED